MATQKTREEVEQEKREGTGESTGVPEKDEAARPVGAPGERPGGSHPGGSPGMKEGGAGDPADPTEPDHADGGRPPSVPGQHAPKG